MVYVAGFGETDDGMDEDVGLMSSGRADGEFAVGSVHWVAGLEGYDAGPVEFREMRTQFGRSDYHQFVSCCGGWGKYICFRCNRSGLDD